MITKRISSGGSILARVYRDQNVGIHIKDYYDYCFNLIVENLQCSDKQVDVSLGKSSFNNCVRLDIQPEHTLVKLGGRSVSKPVLGNIPTDDAGENYLVRIDKFDYYRSLDGVIEYSVPNIVNMQSCFDEEVVDYSKKCRYIAPLIYDKDRLEHNKRSGVFTLFTLGSSSRRDLFHKATGIENIDDEFCSSKLAELYYNKAIMVNIHQTDHHQTFEELRVLPALSQGVIVVAENSPLKEYIPYADSIVWSSLEDMKDVLLDVERNYQSYRNKIFTKKLSETLQDLRKKNISNIAELVWQRKI
jgi:hypothetical protein